MSRDRDASRRARRSATGARSIAGSRRASARLRGSASAQSAAAVERILARGEPVYGVNTGFGKLASVRIADADLARLQRNIVLSHAAGVGAPTPRAIVRLMMALKLASLGQGASGIQAKTLQLLEAMLARGVTPCRADARLGRRLRRSRAAFAHDADFDWRGRGGIRGRAAAGRRGAGARRPGARRARTEGRAGAAQRHAILDRLGARRFV